MRDVRRRKRAVCRITGTSASIGTLALALSAAAGAYFEECLQTPGIPRAGDGSGRADMLAKSGRWTHLQPSRAPSDRAPFAFLQGR